MGQPRPLFRLFQSFQTNNTFFQQINVKNVQMSIQFTAPGFKPMTFHELSPITTRPGHLPLMPFIVSLSLYFQSFQFKANCMSTLTLFLSPKPFLTSGRVHHNLGSSPFKDIFLSLLASNCQLLDDRLPGPML